MDADLAFALLNALVLPWWACWVAAPLSRVSAALASHLAIFALLGALYTLLLSIAVLTAPEIPAQPLGFDWARAMLGTPVGFMAGWVHYLCFDLFVGAWIIRESQRLQLRPRVALFFTLMTGPFGLALFSLRRWQRLRHFGQLGEADLA